MTARTGEGKDRMGWKEHRPWRRRGGDAERMPGVTRGKHQKQARNAGL